MADWKKYINSGFTGCLLLAYARDHCRARDVRIWKIPGEVDAVGIADGTDAWIAPVSADCFSVNVKRLMDDIAAGKPIAKPVPLVQNGRRQLLVEGEDEGTRTMTATSPQIQNMPRTPSGGRRRLLDTESASTPSPTTKARRAALDL